MEAQLRGKLEALEAKEAELRSLLGRIEGFDGKVNEMLVGFYAKMRPEAAAAQLSELDIETAAALLARLKPKVSSAILNEIDAAHGAALVKRLSALRGPTGKHP